MAAAVPWWEDGQAHIIRQDGRVETLGPPKTILVDTLTLQAKLGWAGIDGMRIPKTGQQVLYEADAYKLGRQLNETALRVTGWPLAGDVIYAAMEEEDRLVVAKQLEDQLVNGTQSNPPGADGAAGQTT